MDDRFVVAADPAHGIQMRALLGHMEQLKHLPRTGWVDREVTQPESVAAHSWRLALLSGIYADLLGLDAAACMRMALIHDLPEAVTGDIVPGDSGARDDEEREQGVTRPLGYAGVSREEWHGRKIARERDALTTILGGTPASVARAIAGSWEEYEAQATPEARLVKQLDKLEAYAQGVEYAIDGRLPDRAALEPFRTDVESAVQEPLLRALIHVLDDAVARVPFDPAVVRPEETRAPEPPTR